MDRIIYVFYPAMATLNLAKHLVTRVTFTTILHEMHEYIYIYNVCTRDRSKELASIGECSVGEWVEVR